MLGLWDMVPDEIGAIQNRNSTHGSCAFMTRQDIRDSRPCLHCKLSCKSKVIFGEKNSQYIHISKCSCGCTNPRPKSKPIRLVDLNEF